MKYKRAKIVLHYVMLTVVLFVAHEFSSPLEQIAMAGNWVPLFLYYLIVFYVGDSLIHWVIGAD